MKKFTLTIVAVLLMGCLLLTGCSSFNKIEKAFEKAGYTQTSEYDDYVDMLMAQLPDDIKEDIEEVYVFTAGDYDFAVVIEFESKKKLKDAMNEFGDIEEEYINKNCILITEDDTLVNIFKNA